MTKRKAARESLFEAAIRMKEAKATVSREETALRNKLAESLRAFLTDVETELETYRMAGASASDIADGLDVIRAKLNPYLPKRVHQVKCRHRYADDGICVVCGTALA